MVKRIISHDQQPAPRVSATQRVRHAHAGSQLTNVQVNEIEAGGR